MINFKSMLCLLVIMTLSGCSGVSFLGAKKYINNNYYVERWFLNPEYQEDIPDGTAFYGAAAEKIKHRFIIKYYIIDGVNDDIEIPQTHIWKVKPSKMDERESYYLNTYFYKKIGREYAKETNVTKGLGVTKLPVQYCGTDGWCKTYASLDNEYSDGFKYDLDNVLYIKREHLYQGETILTEKEKRTIIRNNIQAVQALPPFITPSHEVCDKYSGKISKRNVCYAEWKEANQICESSGGRLPTIEEFFVVIRQCGGGDDANSNKNNPKYESCYREKGFSDDGYYSSKVIKKYKTIASVYFYSGGEGLESAQYPTGVMCISL